jgi:hypothetical protein
MYVHASERKRPKREKPWNRCDACGKFIAYRHFEIGAARRWLATPDSDYSVESYGTLCPECVVYDDE